MNPFPQPLQAGDHLSRETLGALIDGELAPNAHLQAREHLAQCHPCTLRALSATELKSVVSSAGRRVQPAADTLARLQANLHAQANAGSLPPASPPPASPHPLSPARASAASSVRPLIPFPPRVAAWSALAAAILLAVFLFVRQPFHANDTAASEILDQHLATLTTGAAPQVLSTDRHTVKPWFQGRLPFSFNLPEPQALPPDVTLQGADLTYLHGQPAALLLYTIHLHRVSVFVTQPANRAGRIPPPQTLSGFSIQAATTHDLHLVAVSDVNAADLKLLLSAIVQAQSLP